MSGDTTTKQIYKRRGQGFEPGHYAIVQRAIDDGEWFEGRKLHVVGFVQSGRRWWKATLKRTKDGGAVYLQSLHRVKERDRLRAVRRYDQVKR